MDRGHEFNTILTQRPNRNNFDLSHDVKMSFKMGGLYPTALIDVVPGDNFRIGVENMIRMAPMIAPVMHEVLVKTFWFFVPNRLLWDGWEDFITGADTEIVPPYIEMDSTEEIPQGSIADYFGLPRDVKNETRFDAMPFAAYIKIWDDWFRDQNITPTGDFIPLVDGDNTDPYFADVVTVEPYTRAWEHDYFTSALPWAQKGDPVSLPLVEDTNVLVGLSGTNAPNFIRRASDGTVIAGAGTSLQNLSGELQSTQTGYEDAFFDPNGTLSVNINEAAVTINQLREAFRMQEFLELDALGGSRYNETIYAHFGVRTKDSRLQRPELVGSFSGKVVISEVLQTAQQTIGDGTTTGNTPLGTMAGHGISVNGGRGLDYQATEHGWLIGLINVQPTTAYQQGIARKWLRTRREDYFWPKFAHIGEQAIMNKELYAIHTNPDGEFGYIPRYSEYRYEPNRVSGEMRTSLAHWHMGRIFDSEPALNASFVYADPTSRIFAILYDSGGEEEAGQDQLYAHVFNNIRASRLMPKYGKPML